MNRPIALNDVWNLTNVSKLGYNSYVLYSTDHEPRHVHVFEDGKRLVKFDIEHWTIMEGRMTAKVKKALEGLRQEGIL